MPRLGAIALAITVLTVGAPCAATADIFGRGDCTAEPGSSAFDPIGCRLWRLRATTGSTLGRGALWAALSRASGNAWDGVFNANVVCQFAKTRLARRRLRRAATLLDRYVIRLRGPSADVIPPDARHALLTEAVAIMAEVTALRARLDCRVVPRFD